MAKWGNPSDETFDLIKEALISANLDERISTKVIVNDEQKTLITIRKESDANLYAYGYHLKIIINESVFDNLTEEYKILAIQESLSGTHWDYENDKLIVNQPNKIHKGFVDKHGWETYESLREVIKSAYDVEANESNVND